MVDLPERPPVLVTRRLPAEALERVRARCEMTLYEGGGAMPRDALLAQIAGKAGAITLLTERVDDEFLAAAGPQLKIVANYAVGFDNIDVDACTRHRVMASNTPEVLTETTADMAFALMMTAARRIAEGDRFLRTRTGWIWGPLMMLGQDVHHKVLGVVGFGRIGQAVARRARGFAMRVLYHDVYRPPEHVEQELGAEYRELDDLLSEADIISLHTNLTPQTRHLINAERLALMKPTAVLVNTSRGPVVDEEALAVALREHRIFAAGIDVFEREPEVHPALFECDNVVLVPHLASATVQTRLAMGNVAADNLLAALDGERPPTLLNPQTWESPASLAGLASRLREDLVSPDAAPHNVRLTLDDRGSEVEGRPAVGCPGDLPNVFAALHLLDAQALAEAAALAKVIHERCDRLTKGPLLLGAQRTPLPVEQN